VKGFPEFANSNPEKQIRRQEIIALVTKKLIRNKKTILAKKKNKKTSECGMNLFYSVLHIYSLGPIKSAILVFLGQISSGAKNL
jgi:hypothetical protein